MLTPLFGSPEYRNTFQRNVNHIFFSLHCISKLCQLNDGHFVQTLTYVKHWRAFNHKAIMNQWNCYKREKVTLNEELDFFCIHWNDCCGSRAVRQMTRQMIWCWTISIYSADTHIRKVSFQPNFYSIYLSIKLIMHKYVQLIILFGKSCFLNDSNGYWNTVDCLVVFKQSNVKWEICRIL